MLELLPVASGHNRNPVTGKFRRFGFTRFIETLISSISNKNFFLSDKSHFFLFFFRAYFFKYYLIIDSGSELNLKDG